jgi:hypothetical protein
VKLDVICCKTRDEHALDTARAAHIPEMMIHTVLKSAQEIETKALNLLNHSNMKIADQKD